MHIPDGFINAPTSIVGGVLAAGLIAVSIKKAGDALDDRQLPLAGLVAAFIFALQMLNFPVAGGTSGHLLGGCLAAVLVGPWVGSLAMSVVFIVQALVFADGGLTALGLNIILMGYTTCFGGYGIFLLIRKLLPAKRSAVVTASAVAAWCGVVLASVVFVGYYALGGQGGAPLGTVAVAMIGVHMLIGIGEAIITGLTVGAVLATRPDLVYGARDLRPALLVGPVDPTGPAASTRGSSA
jgi:cobalt/nickel transport system permease protein